MIKYLIMDVDGSLTDGKVYMGPYGEAMKAFSIKDGYVFNYMLKPNNIIPVIITARTSSIVINRCNELGIEEVYQGRLDKFAALQEIVGENGISSCAYFGDDIIDLNCMMPIKQAGGIIGCPSDAVQEIRAIADYICTNKAGEGALREFSEWLIKPKLDNKCVAQRVKEAIKYLRELTVSEEDIGNKIIVNDTFFYSIQSYRTKPAIECELESHRKYIDIQIIVHGEEVVEFVDISRLTIKEKYDAEKDIMFWNIPQRMARATLREGDCIILYPENAHRGAMTKNSKSHQVLKIIGKVKII